ncbi:MAG: cell surface protein SprA, partial [Candidatus Delongbacteria bacterium]|nr:cell surface protein SprA [Candidatus Delongbacteria bacterium]MCG2759753.1 cell surface protein SprA [Candidatus Delongbacteria bacterium]
DVDYIINYNSGQLSIINDRYLTADIEILYESASIFQLDQKMLLGNRIEYNINKNSYIGGTILYLSEETNEDRVHVGYEPKRNLVMDINGQTNFDLPFLTKAIDWLPLVETDKESNLSFEGEIALIIPNPNPLNAAYIDDFESSKIKKSMGIFYGAWSESSYPDEYSTTGIYTLTGPSSILNISKQYFLKSYSAQSELSFYWYNPKDEDKLTKEEIYKDIPGDQKKDKVNTLNINFKPTTRNEAIEGNIYKPEDSWGGVMRYLYSSYQDMRDVKYIEFLVATNKNITLNIDIGDLSEDVIPDKELNSEDMNRNGVLDIGDDSEDIGLDGMKGNNDFNALEYFDPDLVREKKPYEYFSFDNHPTESDDKPTPDSQINDYWDFIKTEGNGKMDTEDLDGGGNLDTAVRAYRYTVNLKSSPSFGDKYVVSADYSSGSNFALYRIPIEDFADILNREPDLSKMKYIKIWVNNSADTVFSTKINFVTLDFVGNEWTAKGSNQGKIEAKTINNQDDKGRYYSPPGVKKLDDNGFEEFEQSLSLNISLSSFVSQSEYENGRHAYLSKQIYKGENYLQYEEIKMFIHGGTMANDPLWNEERPLYFIYRFGTDSANFYEYRSKLVNGWKSDVVNNQMVVQLSDLTNLKTLRSDLNYPADTLFIYNYNNENIKRYISIKGNPSLQSIKYFNAGVLDSANTELNSEIWIDELRLVKVLKEPGTAMRVKSRLEVADLGSIDAEITHQDEEFHRIEDNKGTGVNQTNISFNSSMNLDKLVPKKYGLSIPVRYSFVNTDSYTKYQGTTDIIVDKNNIPDSVRTETTRNQFDFSIRKTTKSNSPYLKYTVDNLSLSGNASFSESSNPNYISQKSNNYNYNLSYNLGLPESWFSFSPFFWGKDISLFRSISEIKLAFFPSNYNFSIKTGQSETLSLSRRNNFTESRSFLVTRNFSTSLTPLPFLNSNYSLSMGSDMYKDAIEKDSTNQDTVITVYDRDLSDIFMLEFGELSSLESSLNNSLKLNLLKYLTNDLNFKTSYSWTGNLSSRTVTSNVKNRYDSKINSRLKTKEIIGGIQSVWDSFIYKNKDDGIVKETDLDSDKNKINPNDTLEVSDKIENKKSDGTSRLSRTSSSSRKRKSALDFLKENLSDFSLSYAQGRENTFSDIPTLDQANPAFMFGFANKPEDTDYTSSSWSGNWSLNGSTKLGLTKNLSLDGISYQFTRSYRENNNEGFTGTDSETKFVWPWVTDEEHKKAGATPYLIPNYSINISGLRELLKAKDQITTLTISHSKSGSETSNWYVDGKSPGLYLTGIPDISSSNLKIKGVSYTNSFSPLAGFKLGLKNGFNFGASYNYTFDMKETYTYADDIRKIQSGEKKYSRELKITTGYNQKGGFSVPFNFWPFKGAKLDNDINYSLSVSFSSNNRHNYDIVLNEYESLEKGIRSTNFTISPDISYRISKKLNGTMVYSYNYNETQNYDARSVVNTNHKFELRAVLSITGN